ncbi:MAG: xylulokinase [Planctomycetes bacterium]|nr:xylulokinase [Planctomycetota bacterium]
MAGGGLFLGLDVGTQGTKGAVLDVEERAVVARAARSYGLIAGLPPGAAEQHPDTWIDAAAEVTRELLAAPGVERARVEGVGVSGQQHGFVALDEQGAVIRPAKLWCDTATAEEAGELCARLGRLVPAGFTASKILWLKKREPESFQRLCHVLLPHDYLNFRLTGEMTMEAGDASGTGFFDPVRRMFDARAAAAIDEGLLGMLPRLLQPGEPAGRVSQAAAGRFGLQEGVLVAAGGGDNMMSALGSGATRPGVAVVSLGTSGTAFAFSDKPVLDPEGLIAPFCDSTGGWLPLLCVMNVTGVTEEVHAAFPGKDLETLTAEAERVPAGCSGLLFVPYLLGERVPDLPRATGCLFGLRPGLLSAGALFRAAIEGTSLNLGWGIERMRRLGIDVSRVRLAGGGSKNRLWREVLADVLGAPVEALLEPESAALGAALSACWTRRRAAGDPVSADSVCQDFVRLEPGEIEPDPARGALYQELLERFRDTVEWLYG